MQVESAIGLIVDSIGGFLQQLVDLSSIDSTTLFMTGGLLILLVVMVGGRAAYQYYHPSRKLYRLLGDADAATILMHPNPDPDAMGTALGVAELAADTGTEPRIRYAGEIRHHENRAFRTVLGLDAERIESSEDIDTDCVVLVDHAQPRGFEGCEDVSPTAIIDHHDGEAATATFTDIRADYGACASIIAEYLEELEKTPSDRRTTQNDITTETATGLLYGVLSDTDYLTNGCVSADFDACEILFPTIDESQLTRIRNPQVDAELLDVKARAISHRDVRSPYCVSDVGTVSNLDAIPQAAEELISLEGVTVVIVLGKKDGTVHLSGRSRDDRVHIGKTLSTVIEDIPVSEAGGHARMGGGQVSVEHLESFGPADGYTEDDLIELLFQALQGNEAPPAAAQD